MFLKLQNTLYTLNECELCLGTNLLLSYGDGKGEGEETIKEFSLKEWVVLSKMVGVLETSLGFTIWIASLQFCR